MKPSVSDDDISATKNHNLVWCDSLPRTATTEPRFTPLIWSRSIYVSKLWFEDENKEWILKVTHTSSSLNQNLHVTSASILAQVCVWHRGVVSAYRIPLFWNVDDEIQFMFCVLVCCELTVGRVLSNKEHSPQPKRARRHHDGNLKSSIYIIKR